MLASSSRTAFKSHAARQLRARATEHMPLSSCGPSTSIRRLPPCTCASPGYPPRRRWASSAAKPTLPTPKPDISHILSNPSAAIADLRNRKTPLSLDAEELVHRIREYHEQSSSLLHRVKELRSQRNNLGKVLASRDASEEERSNAKREAGTLRDQLRSLEHDWEDAEAQLLDLSLQLSNTSSPSSPIGNYDAIEIVRQSAGRQAPKEAATDTTTHGPPQPNPRADHLDLLEQIGWVSMSPKVTGGGGWPFLLRGAAKLELALIQYAISTILETDPTFEVVIPPDVVKREVMGRCGFMPRDAGGEAQTYFVSTTAGAQQQEEDGSLASAEDGLALAATAEIPLAGYFSGDLYRQPASELPKKFVGVSHAFRAEAGARGKESRGLYRVHQFTKVEMFVVTKAEQSEDMLDRLVEMQWKLLDSLGLPLRLLNMPTEELGGPAYQKYDIEAYMPGRGSWGELASASNCTDYQARRLDMRYLASEEDKAARGDGAKTIFAHTLNATAAAIPRLIVALVENGAVFDEAGTWVALELPAVLRKHWLGAEAHQEITILPLTSATAKKGIALRWV